MTPVTTKHSAPPTPQQVDEHLDRWAVRRPPVATAWAPWMVLVFCVALGVVSGGGWALVLMWFGLVTFWLIVAARTRRFRRLESQVNAVRELAVLRRWRQALRTAWRTLPSVATAPPMHDRLVAMMALCLDQLGAYEAAITAYDYLIDRLPPDEPIAVQASLQRAIAQLADNRLTDADHAIRVQRAQVDSANHPVLSATFRLAELIQQIKTNHWNDAARDSHGLVDALRPLGIDAANGYALAALAHLGQSDSGATSPEQAQRWWRRATLLLPRAALTGRFPELHRLDGLQDAAKPWAGGRRA